MWHDLARVLAEDPPSSGTSPLLLALLGAVGLILSTTLPLLIAKWLSRRKDAQDELDGEALEAHYDALRIWLVRRGIDARKIQTGYENDADVRVT